MSGSPPSPRHERRIVPPEGDGQRLDRFVAAVLGISRSRAHTLIRGGRVTVDGERRKPSFVVASGAVMDVEIPAPTPSHILPQPIPLQIVFEDEDIVVVDKPPGLVVHPGAGNPDRTLVNALVHHCPEIEGVGGVRRPGIVHRLDRNTSGLLVAAKTEAAFAELVAALQRREVERRYHALVWGRLEGSREINAPIGRDVHNRKRMAVREDGGRPAVTLCRGLRWFDFLSLVDLTLRTGRTHQIRVHMAHIGFPVFGDPEYGGRMRRAVRLPATDRRVARGLLRDFPRQALHAWCLEFRHPRSGRPLRFEAAPPPDLTRLLRTLEGTGRPDHRGEVG